MCCFGYNDWHVLDGVYEQAKEYTLLIWNRWRDLFVWRCMVDVRECVPTASESCVDREAVLLVGL